MPAAGEAVPSFPGLAGASVGRLTSTDATRIVAIMDEEVFRTYIAEFNVANFDALARYYAEDVVLSFNGGLTLHGRDAIVEFYRPFRTSVDETVDIKFLMINDKHVAVEMATEFRAREDYANFTRGPLKAGDTVRITSFVHYDIGPDGRFAAIRVGRYGD
jgi:hypothetical protein